MASLMMTGGAEPDSLEGDFDAVDSSPMSRAFPAAMHMDFKDSGKADKRCGY